MGITVLSLFDGISCGQIALERAGIEVDTYYASEIKKHAIETTLKHYPETVEIGDVRKVWYNDGTLYTEKGNFKVGEIDLLIGGSPCQNFSIARVSMGTKKMEGLNGDKGKHEIKLLKQCMYKVLGYSDHTTYYRSRGTRQKIGIYCTKAQRIEIELEFEFYRNVFYEELTSFMNAFIQAQGIFPTDAPQRNRDLWELSEDELRQLQIAAGIKKRTRAAMIEEREADNEATQTGKPDT